MFIILQWDRHETSNKYPYDGATCITERKLSYDSLEILVNSSVTKILLYPISAHLTSSFTVPSGLGKLERYWFLWGISGMRLLRQSTSRGSIVLHDWEGSAAFKFADGRWPSYGELSGLRMRQARWGRLDEAGWMRQTVGSEKCMEGEVRKKRWKGGKEVVHKGSYVLVREERRRKSRDRRKDDRAKSDGRQ